MKYIRSLLKHIIDEPGLSGFETPVVDIVKKEWSEFVDVIEISQVGSLHGIKRSAASKNGNSKKHAMMIATHIDAIGMMVTRINGDFLNFTDVGGIDPRILPGTPVLVHGSAKGGKVKKYEGIIAIPHLRSMPAGINGTVPMDKLLIDIGMSQSELAERIHIGDLISFNTHPTDLGSDLISGHSIDNRASVVALSSFLHNYRGDHPNWDIYAAATAQEEVNFAGSYTSSHAIKPDLAIVIDVTFAKGPGSSDWKTFPLGKGITLGIGPNIHTKFMQQVKSIAEENEIPVVIEPMPKHSGTDAYAVQVSNEGIPTIVIGIPIRYMHTPVEVVSLQDIKRVERLLSAIMDKLDEKFLKKISWDDSDEK